MENIVRLSELDQFVADTIDKVIGGVTKARALGHQAELPQKIDFQVIVIKDWQALDIVAGESAQTEETQGGGSTETSTSKGKEDSQRNEGSTTKESRSGSETTDSTDKTTTKDESTSEDDQLREENSAQEEERKQKSTETTMTKDTSEQKERASTTESGSQEGTNAHVENGEDASDSRTDNT